jgi:hypothetical protein
VTLMNRLYSKEELPKINEEDVNVYMRKEKKETRTCKRLHGEYSELMIVCQVKY